MPRRLLSVVGSAALVIVLAGCKGRGALLRSGAPRHLVLVTIDTLRADHVGCYGGTVATPNLDRIAAQGAMVAQVSVTAPQTAPSHASILTGLLPAEHGIRDNIGQALATSATTLAEVLQKAGFPTAGFVSAIVLDSKTGLNRGFETYSDRFEQQAGDAQILNELQERGDVTLAEAVSWMEGHPEGRTFVWLHLYDPHDPYTPPEPFAGRYPGKPYEGEVAWTDEIVGRLDAALKRLGRTDDTLLVVTSDHGEGLGDHGEQRHGYFVYESTLRVPLILRGPGIPAGAQIKVAASSVDLFPTLLDLLGIAAPGSRPGRSLAPALQGQPLAEVAAYAECLVPLLHFGWSDLRALRDGRWKYIQAPKPELFDLSRDPGELKNLLADEPAHAAALRAELARRLQAERATASSRGGADVDPERLEKLGALGYLGAGTVEPGAHTGADPKDKLEEFKLLNVLMSEGMQLLQAGDHAGAANRLGRLLQHVDTFEGHYYLAEALMGLRRLPEAEAQFARAAELLPATRSGHCRLAETRLAMGNPAGALEALDRAGGAISIHPRVLQLKGEALRRLNRLPEAIAAYEAAAAQAPQEGILQAQLGDAYRANRNLPAAVRAFRAAVALEPGQASFRNGLGIALAASGQLAEAERELRSATASEPRRSDFAYNLGVVLLQQGRVEEASAQFRLILEREPSFAPARRRLVEIQRGGPGPGPAARRRPAP